jgi:hypothetical protein
MICEVFEIQLISSITFLTSPPVLNSPLLPFRRLYFNIVFYLNLKYHTEGPKGMEQWCQMMYHNCSDFFKINSHGNNISAF